MKPNAPDKQRQRPDLVLLDRDGVLNKEIGDYVYQLDKLEIIDGVVDVLKKCRDLGYIFVIVTNQSGIAKGIYDHAAVKLIHDKMNKHFLAEGIDIKEYYYCPHHPDYSQCLCRKPGSMMVEKALARFDIDPSKSFLVGDRDRDIEAGEAVGVTGVKIESNEGLTSLLKLVT